MKVKKRHNILSFLIKNENSTTEMFYALLSFKPFREVVIRSFTNYTYGADTIRWDNIDTQVSIGTAIPDMMISGEKLHILVEIKTNIYTALTENQPESYLNWLLKQNTGKQKYFIALVPSRYKHLVDLKKNIQTFNQNNFGHNITISIVTWEVLLKNIYENDLHLLNEYIHDFYELLYQWYKEPKIKLSIEEIQLIYNSSFVKSLSKLIKTTDEVIAGLEQNHFTLEKVQNKKWWEDEYAVYVNYKEQPILWFGIWPHCWEECGIPLGYGVDQEWDENVVREFQRIVPETIVFPPEESTTYRIKGIGKEILASSDPVSKIIQLLEDCLTKLSAQIDKPHENAQQII